MCFYYAMTFTSFFVLFGVESCCPPVAAFEVSASCAKGFLFLGRVGVVGFCMFIILFFLGCSLQYWQPRIKVARVACPRVELRNQINIYTPCENPKSMLQRKQQPGDATSGAYLTGAQTLN
jgi:hypothetical protein